ncbi:MAG: hypothetical protein BMS9Abin02_0975 [Anaerolineae bacterium]|nr:MAG: hypothetical protein BMS9Abin02_0975 [Anaerolineae bacterium]
MISLSIATELKACGLVWEPSLHDFFAIPDSDLDNRIFVVSDMMIDFHQLFGRQIITFNGAVEWSLDNIMMADAVWMPTESQLRELVQGRLLHESDPSIQLLAHGNKYHCKFTSGESTAIFEAADASDAYGMALLQFLQEQ